MQDNQYKEVLIVVIACIMLFLILAAIILRFLFMYQRRRLLQTKELEELRQQLTEQSLKSQVEIQEQTLHAISQEIHDNVGQVLSLAKVQVNIMTEKDSMDLSLMEDVRDNIGKAMADLRDLARSLSSDRIRSGILPELLAQEMARINKSGAIRAEIEVEGEVRELDPRKKLIVFRVVQETIQNCLKHAQATNISIRCVYYADCIEVAVRDNGKGFDPETAMGSAGMGLGNIRTRVLLIGGSSRIESRPQQGTHVFIKIPYE
jgi:two-component system, NarL family, sensor kinase